PLRHLRTVSTTAESLTLNKRFDPFGTSPDPPPALTDGRKASRFSITNYLKAKPEDFRELANLLNLVQEKKFQVIIDRSFPLAEARAAQRHLEGRGHFGKVVLKMN